MAKEKGDFDADFDKAMDKAGFAEFLAKNGDDKKEMEDQGKMQERLQTFESLTVVQKEYKNICKEKLSRELGIKLEDADLKAIDEHVEKLAFTDTERLKELHEKFDKHEKLNGEVSAWKSKVANLERGEAKSKGFWGTIGAFMKNRTYGSVLRAFKENAQNDITDTKAEILTEIHQIDGLHDKILAQVAKQMNEMLGKAATVKDLHKVQERFEFLKNAQEGADGINIDLLSELPEAEFQQKVDDAIEMKAFEEIMAAALGAPLGNGAFSKLEKTLMGYFDTEKFGSKEDDDARKMILKTMEEVSDQYLGDGVEGQAKKLMVLRIIQKAKAK